MFKSENSLETYQRDLCFIDVETTGAQFGFHEIIDIGVIRTCASAETIRFEWQHRIAPLHPERITQLARQLNGFSVQTWTSELPSREVWTEFVERVSGAVPVCHNPSFERAFISLAAAQHDILDLGLDHHWIGTESLSWPLVKTRSLRRFSLESLCAYLDLPCETIPHTSLGGADACFRVYKRLMELYAQIPTDLELTST